MKRVAEKKETKVFEELRWKVVVDDVALTGPVMLFTGGNLVSLESQTKLVITRNEIPIEDALPSSVEQVFVINSVASAYYLRNAHGKILTSDSLGKISFTKDAVGKQEEWTIQMHSYGQFSFQDYLGRYLGVADGGTLRADSQEPESLFIIKWQVREKEENLSVPETAVDENFVERDSRRYMSFKKGSLQLKDRELLKKAENEGNLKEVLLNLRTKSKHDPFC